MISTNIITAIFGNIVVGVSQIFAGFSITEGFLGRQFASTKLKIFYFLLDCEFERFEICSQVGSVAPRLL